MSRTRHYRRAVLVLVLVFGSIPVRVGASDAGGGARIRLEDSIKGIPIGAPASQPHRVREELTASELAESLNIVVSLRMRDFDRLEARIHSGQTVPKPEMEANYLPAQADCDRVASWLKSQGLTLTLVDSNHTNVFARGTVAQISAALGVTFARVLAGDGEFTSAVTAPSLPEDIAGVVLGIEGLQPHIRMHAPKHEMDQSDGLPSVKGYFTPADILSAYNVPSKLNGAGQTIAIIMDAAPVASDLSAFWGAAGIPEVPVSFATIPVNGGPTASSQLTDAVEVTLDAEWATGMAPGANLRIYATASLLDSDLIAACTQILNYAATDATLREVSYSASGPEDQAASGTLHGYSQTFAQLAAAGITFFCSSGDGGSNPDPTVSGPNGYSALYPLTVEYPASDPNVTGVGGTTVAFDSNYNAILSSAWTPGFAGTLGTGGGYSTAFTRPSWQSGAGVPGGTARCVPDVAAVAQGSMGGVGFGALLILNGQDSGRVGTSLSSPVWAGIGAAINQDRTSHGLAPVGLLGPWVYSLIGSIGFTDIISGNNGAYAAGIGYDLCTGIGSPNVANLVALIDEEITSVGPPASPVNPGTLVTMSATPQLPSTYQWQLNGVKISGATGSTYTISSATAASAGTYTVVITNSLGTFTYSIGTLAVYGGPVISAQPTGVSAILGQAAGFTVIATATPAPAYQWLKNGTNIAGATSSTFSITSVQLSDAANYSVIVSNPYGTVTSNTAKLTVNGPPTITTQPASQAVNAGANVTLSVVASGVTGYQWQLNGAAIAGATSATLSLPRIGTTQRGSYTVVTSDAYGSATSNPATVAVNVTANLSNISARAFVGTGSQVLVAGFVVSGSGSKQLLIRGAGPTLAQYSVAGPLANPQLSLYDSTSAVIATDIGWGNASTKGPSTVSATIQAATSALFNQVYAFLFSTGSADCAMSAGLPVSQYTAQVSGVGGTTGVALAELYDADTGTPSSHLINISARAYVGTGSQVLVAGFVITGTTPETVLIRGVGPTEAQYGVAGSLAAPQLALYDSSSAIIATNAGWGNGPVAGPSTVSAGLQPATSAVFSSVYAFGLASGSADCAMVVTLPPGSYTAQVSGVGSTTGVALIEVYNLP